MSDAAITQSDAIYDALSAFYQAVSDAVKNGTAPPNASGLATSLTYTELQAMASLASKSSPTFAIGSAVETTHLAASVLREYGMRVKGKSEYYQAGIDDHANESDYFDKLKYMHGASLAGTNINGSLTQ